MRILLVILAIYGLPYWGCTQVDPLTFDYSQIDSIVKADILKEEKNSADEIAEVVNKRFSSPHEKYRAIYIWISSTIAYDTTYRGTDPDSVITKKLGVCGGYSSLLQTLATKVGVNCPYVTGHCHDGLYAFDPLPEESNHAWNEVTLYGIKYLTDITWATGHFDVDEQKSVRKFNESYFLVPPATFVYDHYPDSSKYLNLTQKIALKDFEQFPNITDAFRHYNLTHLKPAINTINCEVGERIYFGFNTPVEDLEYLELGIEDESEDTEWTSIAYKRVGNDVSWWWEFQTAGTYRLSITILEDRIELIDYKVVVN